MEPPGCWMVARDGETRKYPLDCCGSSPATSEKSLSLIVLDPSAAMLAEDPVEFAIAGPQ